MPDLFRGRKWDLVGKRRYWYIISSLVIASCLYALIARGLNYGIDFTGGGLLTYRVPHSIPAGQQGGATADLRDTIDGLGIPNFVQIAGPPLGGKNLIVVRTQFPAAAKTDAQRNDAVTEQSDKILEALAKDPRFTGIRPAAKEVVGSVVSQELISKALMAVALGSVFILLWIMVRYDFKFSVTGIAALIHDVIVQLGFFAWLQRPVESPFVAAILTVVGYSVHDTIVIFDRIRENVKLRKGASFAETTNISLLETMARSVNTVLTVEFTLLALYFFGGATVHDFVLALLIGVTTGAYSSIFIASQLLTGWKEREERRRAVGRPAPPVVTVGPRRRPEPAPARSQPQPEAAAAQPAQATPVGADSAAQPKAKRKPGGKAGKRKKRF